MSYLKSLLFLSSLVAPTVWAQNSCGNPSALGSQNGDGCHGGSPGDGSWGNGASALPVTAAASRFWGSQIPLGPSAAPVKPFSAAGFPDSASWAYSKVPSHPHSPPAYQTASASVSGSWGFTIPAPTGSAASALWSASYSPSVASASYSPGAASSVSPSNSAIPSACYYWMEDVKRQGLAAFNANPGQYTVFRNVKDFGAKGDGSTDDTAAINAAISSGSRCAPGTCGSSTTSPAVIYFPPGTYIVSTPIIDYYYTQLIGNPNCPPVIKASAGFTGAWVVDGDQYQNSGNLGWGATNVFWRQIRNFVIDMTSLPSSAAISGVHWPTGQATSLQNIVFQMAPGSQSVGVFIESGSGGFVTDLVFNGGFVGLNVGNQQFTMRNLTFNGCATAINQIWDWGWTYIGLNINNCGIGINMAAADSTSGILAVGSMVVVDSVFSNTPIGIQANRSSTDPSAGGGAAANSLILDNVQFSGVSHPVTGPGGTTVLTSNSVTSWGQGHKYTPNGPQTFQGSFSSQGRSTQYVQKSKPQYGNIPASGFLSARSEGAKGDGSSDDTAALNAVFAKAAAQGKIVYIDHGDYLVTDTVYIPPGTKAVGETYPVIMSAGSKFGSQDSPLAVLQVGKAGESGSVEVSDLIISTTIQGGVNQAGAILVEYNLATSSGSGLWDVHTRVGGFAGSNLQIGQCVKQPGSGAINSACISAFMSMHITKSASGFYGENNWLWVADHDIEDPNLTQISLYAGRGLLIESQAGNNVLWGSAVEHHVLYQYNLASTKDIVLGQLQTETAYYQPLPAAPAPFSVNPAYADPAVGVAGWGLSITGSTGVNILGAGLYSFFNNYDVNCSNQGNTTKCQDKIFNVQNSQVEVYNLNTVGTQSMIAAGGNSVAEWSDNRNGFVSTVALFQISQ